MTLAMAQKAVVGLFGTTVSFWSWFADANVVVGFIVGLLTAIYMSLQIYFLLKNRGKK